MKPVSVLMVCMGNICRSPTAHAVFARKVYDAGLAMRIRIDSAGTFAGHKGEPPDKRARARGAQRGYDLEPLRSRPLRTADFAQSTYIIVMDEMNLREVDKRALALEAPFTGTIAKLLDYAPDAALHGDDVPDPYYGPQSGFDVVFDLVEPACDGLLKHIIAHDFARARGA
jgi:protein-tyrosine phosphatase